MGTSISQPSPKNTDWKSSKVAISNGESVGKIIASILDGFYSEYGQERVTILVDSGVKKVIEILSEKSTILHPSPEEFVTSFILEARRELAIHECNSFFAELALTAGSKAIVSDPNNTSSGFVVEYAARIFDYVISRDLPTTIGSRGVVNLETLSKLLVDVKSECKRQQIQQGDSSDAIDLLHKLFSQRREAVSYTHLTLPTTPYV